MSWIRDEMDVSNGLRRDELRPGPQVAVHMMSLGDSIPLFQRFHDVALFTIGGIDGFCEALPASISGRNNGYGMP
ncbi:hypothetical protein G6L80_23945 [Agrobacterium rhizogenes]|nr:hypothetical protein [Rhizobium rhizogenes]